MSDWPEWTRTTYRGLSLGVDQWRVDAELVGVRIVGGLAIAPQGVLRSPFAFATTIRAGLIASRVPTGVAEGVSAVIWEAWKEWADGVSIPSLPWYPAFFAWPSPVAPPMPNVPTPLGSCPSAGVLAMSPARLNAAFKTRLGSHAATPAAEQAIDRLSAAIGASFATWIGSALVTMAFGFGTAPVGPLMPLAPVTGTLLDNGRGCLVAAVPFPATPLLY